MKNNMKNKWLVAGAVAAFVACSATVQAIPIVGTINFSEGGVTFNSTSVQFINPSSVATGVGLAPTGSFAGTGGAAVTFLTTGFTFLPSLSPNPVSPLWTFTSGLLTYSFSLSSVSVITDTGSFLSLAGAGTLTITGTGSPYTATNAKFNLSSTGSGPSIFGFVAGNSAPDGGTTVMLLGAGLSGLALLRKKLAA
jgi:hypothetical protein